MKKLYRIIYHIASVFNSDVKHSSEKHRRNGMPGIDDALFDLLLNADNCIREDHEKMTLKYSENGRFVLSNPKVTRAWSRDYGISVQRVVNDNVTNLQTIGWDDNPLRRSTMHLILKRFKFIENEHKREQKNMELNREVKNDRELMERMK